MAVNTTSPEDTTQSLIDEVETYLLSVSGGVSTASLEEAWTPPPPPVKVDEADRNLGDQADATLTHLKALILIHNNNTSKIKNGACHQPGPACRPVSAVDRRPRERNFFFGT